MWNGNKVVAIRLHVDVSSIALTIRQKATLHPAKMIALRLPTGWCERPAARMQKRLRRLLLCAHPSPAPEDENRCESYRNDVN
jgi:hypothetical protein